MTCRDGALDYLCEGWRQRRAHILQRDGYRCRGCNRSTNRVNLEVHHRRYGRPGPCGSCPLTGVEDVDLVTLCGDGGCHEAVDAVRKQHGGRLPPLGEESGHLLLWCAILTGVIVIWLISYWPSGRLR